MKKRYVAYVIVIIGVFCMALFLYTLVPTSHTVRIPESIKDDTGLASYWIHGTYNPIVGLPGTDVDALRGTIHALHSSLDPLLEFYSLEEQKEIQHLYPYEFLDTLPDTEEARRTFIATPTHEHARLYHANVVASLQAYQHNLQSLMDVLATLPDAHLTFLDGSTSITFMHAQLVSLQTTVATHLQNEHARFACIESYTYRCKYTQTTRKLDIEDISVPNVPEKVYRYAKFIRESYQYTDHSLPVIALNDAACYPYSDISYYVFNYALSRIGSVPMIQATIANDILVYDTEKIKDVHPFYDELRRSGALYSPQLINPYLCTEFSGDIGRVQTAHYIYKVLKEHEITRGSNDVRVSTVAALEDGIVSMEGVLSEGVINEYVSRLEGLVQSLGDVELENLIGGNGVDRIHDILLVHRTQSASLETTLGFIDDTVRRTILVSRSEKIPVEVLFLTRSHISTLYLLNNETLVPRGFSLIEKKTVAPLSVFKLVSYEKEIEDSVSLEEILEQVRKSTRAFIPRNFW